MHKEDQTQVYEMLSVLLLTLSKGQQVQQCIRQVLTSHPLFSPLPLFKYISRNNTVIKKQNLLQFLQENKEHAEDEEIKNLMEFEPGKKSWQYKDFLEFIYPFNSAVLREISTMHLKRYPKLQKYGAPESTLAAFLLLLTEHLSLLRKLQIQKSDSIKKIPKQRLKKVFLSIKKAGDKQPSHCQNDDTRITSLQLRNFMKAFVSVEDSHFLFLSRKLGLKDGFVLIEQLEKFIKPAKKTNKRQGHKTQKATPTKPDHSPEKKFDEQEYKDQILQAFNQDVCGKQMTKRNSYGLRQQPRERPTPFQPKEKEQILKKEEKPNIRVPIQDNYFMESQKKPTSSSSSSPKDLLLRFVQIFLPVSRKLQQLKARLAQQRLDYFKLFKIIDRNSRGVVAAEDLFQYYRWAGGKKTYIPKDFQLIIERYAQSEEPWITLTQFCQMVRAEDKDSHRVPPSLNGQAHQLVLSIIQASLQGEQQILRIRSQFEQQQSKYLFNLINKEHTGFINYQQLKRFLCEAGLNLSMHDLMSVLKRLDRSRNGVVVQHEFVSYFRPPKIF